MVLPILAKTMFSLSGFSFVPLGLMNCDESEYKCSATVVNQGKMGSIPGCIKMLNTRRTTP